MGSFARGAIAFAVAAWCGAVGFGVHAIYAYSTTPGARGDAEARWPAASALPRDPGAATLVMFVHPDCPCTSASVAELLEITRATTARLQVVFVVAPGASGGGDWTPPAELARSPRVLDLDAREARLFGAQTSGHVVLYDAAGRLRFAGGITGSRGHTGDNIGRQAVLGALADASNAASAAASHDVFGCALEDEP
nr:hypothetical protein [Kofleriaceae bacterium]